MLHSITSTSSPVELTVDGPQVDVEDKWGKGNHEDLTHGEDNQAAEYVDENTPSVHLQTTQITLSMAKSKW